MSDKYLSLIEGMEKLRDEMIAYFQKAEHVNRRKNFFVDKWIGTDLSSKFTFVVFESITPSDPAT